MLAVRGVEKSYGDIRALRGANADVAAGTITALLGRNGAGKSTLLSIIAGLATADAGSVMIDGVDVIAQPRRARGLVGIAPQNTGIYYPLTVRENLEFFGELTGMDRAKRRARALDVAERLALVPLLDRRAVKLSGGEARRLHTACALLHQPKVLLLDEPTVGADVATRAMLIDAVRHLAREGAAVVYTTHYLPEVEALDAAIAVIDNGVVLATGSKEQLMSAHRLGGIDFEVGALLSEAVAASLGATAIGGRRYRVADESVNVRDVAEHLHGAGATIVAIEARQPDLGSVFLALTGTHLAGEPGVDP